MPRVGVFAGFSLAFLVGCSFFLLGGCNLTSRHLQFHDEYFVQQPVLRTFDFERRFKDGSFLKGTLTYNITRIIWNDPANNGCSYGMAGTVDMSAYGTATTADSAFILAPSAAIKSAMKPDNVPEVFEEVEIAPRRLSRDVKPPPGVSGDFKYIAYKIHRDRLRALQLPICFEKPSQTGIPFNSQLFGSARNAAGEMGMVWLKGLLLQLDLLAPLSKHEFVVTALTETPAQLRMTYRWQTDAQTNQLVLTFSRGFGLVAVDGELADGSLLTIKVRSGRALPGL